MSYGKLDYDKHLNRINNGLDKNVTSIDQYSGQEGRQTEGGAVEVQPVSSAQSLSDLWITSFIRSIGWKTNSRGFNIDGESGSAEFSGILVRGTIVANGGFTTSIRSVTQSTSVDKLDYTILCNTGTTQVTLRMRTARRRKGQIYVFKKTNSGGSAMVIQPSAGEKIDGADSLSTTTHNKTFQVQSDGNGWYVIN